MEELAQAPSTVNGSFGKEITIHRDLVAYSKNEGDCMNVDGETHPSTYLLRGRPDPCNSICTYVAPQGHFSNLTSRVAGRPVESEPVTSDTEFTDMERLFLADEFELSYTGLQNYNLNDIFEGFRSPSSTAVAAPVQKKNPELEVRSFPGDYVNALRKPAILNRSSRFGWLGKKKYSDTRELNESTVFRRKYLVKEYSEVWASPSSTVQNSGNDGLENYNTSRGIEIDEDEFRHGQGNCGNLHEFGEEVLMKTMSWLTFPVECPNDGTDATLSLRWRLDDLPSASDLPRLESLMEISPSKFWSPNSEPSSRTPVQLGYLNSSASPQLSHSIQYVFGGSPASPSEMTGAFIGGNSGLRMSSEKSNQCSPACRNILGTLQKILTPRLERGESIETGVKPTSSGSGRKLDEQIEGAMEMCPAPSENNSKRSACGELNKATPVHQRHSRHHETGSVANCNLTASDAAARRLQHSHRGKNLVMDFLEVSRNHESIEAGRNTNSIPCKCTTVHSSGTLRTENEKKSGRIRLQHLSGVSNEERESLLPPSELQIIRGADRNSLTARASQYDQSYARKRDEPFVPLSDTSSHPNLAISLRNSLHEKLESQLFYPKPIPESQTAESTVTFQCPKPTQGVYAWSTQAVPRVSRKRSKRVTTPKVTREDVLNLFGNRKVAQPVRSPPDKDFNMCKRQRTIRRGTYAERQSSERNDIVQSSPASDSKFAPRDMGIQEGTSPLKPPKLIRIVKPWKVGKTSPAKVYTCVSRKWKLRSTVMKRLPTDLQDVNSARITKSVIVKHSKDVGEPVAMSKKNPGSSESTTRRSIVKDDSLRTLPNDSDVSNGILRSSKYRGVTRHRHTGRYEAHLWDNTKVKLGLAKRGRQVYLGAYPDEDQAAQAHDLAALKYWGPNVYTNFPLIMYEEELKSVESLTKEEYIVILRRRSPGFTRGISKYRGVTRHHQEGRWEARIGRHSGAKYHYLGTYETQEEAAAAYDRAAVSHRGVNAITNFDISNYIKTKPGTKLKLRKIVCPSPSSEES